MPFLFESIRGLRRLPQECPGSPVFSAIASAHRARISSVSMRVILIRKNIDFSYRGQIDSNRSSSARVTPVQVQMDRRLNAFDCVRLRLPRHPFPVRLRVPPQSPAAGFQPA